MRNELLTGIFIAYLKALFVFSRAEFIFKELRQAGFHAAIQHYTTKDESFNEAEVGMTEYD